MRFLLLTFLMISSALATSAKSHQETYIEKYSKIAVAEMYRSGVPASITLAQGLLESGYGRSELALKSNNHFGIKCHNGWQGGRVYHDDDARGECFRKYDDPEDSYRDHSDFLRYRDRYKFLFEYEITDYKSWAYGLKKAGYATDPSYPTKLIKLIEDYQLHQYDKQSSAIVTTSVKTTAKPAVVEKKQEIPAPPSQIEQVSKLTTRKAEEFHFSLFRQLYSQNGVPFIYASADDTYQSIAHSNNLFLKELLRFNDLEKEVDVVPGTVIYLQKKKNQATKGLEMHVIEKGETLRGISQRYGVRVKSLMKINSLKNPDMIREGDIIKLRK